MGGEINKDGSRVETDGRRKGRGRKETGKEKQDGGTGGSRKGKKGRGGKGEEMWKEVKDGGGNAQNE